MSEQNSTSLERVLTTLGHKEPDRVPLFLLVTMHGAKELGASIREYFSKGEYVAEGQVRMRKKYRHDCYYAFFYAAIEVEAWGGEVIFYEDGPPNAGEPIIKKKNDIRSLEFPRVTDNPPLLRALNAIEILKGRCGDDAPIIGVVMSPFSLPVMQMGYESYLDIIYEDRALFDHLMKVNEEFCVNWANAQISAGATAICYFDPLSSPTNTDRELYLKTGFEVARRTISRINGPTATHMASGRSLAIIDDLADTGTLALGVSALENLSEVKASCSGRLTVIGNLNGIEMRRWTAKQAENAVRDAIAKAAPGGGFILSDNHGEIPWQVPEDVLLAITDANDKWGRYPLEWLKDYEK